LIENVLFRYLVNSMQN